MDKIKYTKKREEEIVNNIREIMGHLEDRKNNQKDTTDLYELLEKNLKIFESLRMKSGNNCRNNEKK